MSNGEPYLSWSATDERLVVVVKEMIRDGDSKRWEECINFVKQRVHANARNIPASLQEDIIQEVMFKVTKYLPHFRFQCTLKTWLTPIIKRTIIDSYRKLKNERVNDSNSSDTNSESDSEGEERSNGEVKSAEDDVIINDEIRGGSAALLEYANKHSNSVRNRHIIRMVIFEERSYDEVAKATGCNTPVVGYVIREAQRYAREKMDHRP